MADIIETAIAAGVFTQLVKAVQAAGLGATLKGAGPFTVFAPTDEAFAKLPQGTLDLLLLNPVLLQQILTYHVVPGRVRATDLAGASSQTTVQGTSLSIDTTNGVKVNSAKVVQADIETDNGVIHVIDSVLLPLPGRQFAEQSARTFRQTVDSLAALTPGAALNPVQQFYTALAGQTEAVVRANFTAQNALLDAGITAFERAGGNRNLVDVWADLVRQTQQTTLDVWETTTRK